MLRPTAGGSVTVCNTLPNLCYLFSQEPIISVGFIKFLFLDARTIASPCGVSSLSLSRCFRLRLVGNLTVRVNKKKFLFHQTESNGTCKLPRFVNAVKRTESFLFSSYGCCSRMSRLLHRLSTFSCSVVQPARLSPAWSSLAFQRSSNQREFKVD